MKISNSRTNLVCKRCGGIVGYLDDETRKLTPNKREWSEVEKFNMR